jgi:transcriptional antiterminator RfaH
LRVNPVNPRARKIRPYFPGYIFVNADLKAVGLSVFRHMPYAVGLVSFGGEPAPVSETLILTLRRRLDEIARAGGEAFLGLKHGDRVAITGGPFAGYEALFDARITGADRVRVLLQMLSDRYVRVEMEANWIEQVGDQLSARSYQR